MSLILAEFSASWCIASQVMKPITYRVCQKYKDRGLLLYVINVDQEKSATKKYNLQGCPTFIMLKANKEVDRCVGAQSEAQLKEFIEKWM